MLLIFQTNKNLDMSINASNNFKLNVTWSLGSTGIVLQYIFICFVFYVIVLKKLQPNIIKINTLFCVNKIAARHFGQFVGALKKCFVISIKINI